MQGSEGLRLLEEAQWAAAKDAFEADLEQEETPDALDGIGLALFFLGTLEEGIAAGAILLGVGGAAESELFAIVGAVVALVGFGSAGLMVLSETDEAWEHTPEVEGFRALPGM